ncbi:MAG: hypothetical protein WCZ08_03300 [Parcubacteria group bacterium]|jgi:hypothetical protein|nr:hypothetical protein [Candidatus Moranbacteria bacterium]
MRDKSGSEMSFPEKKAEESGVKTRLESIRDSVVNIHDKLIECDRTTDNALPECFTDLVTGIVINAQIISMENGKNPFLSDEEIKILNEHAKNLIDLEKERREKIKIEGGTYSVLKSGSTKKGKIVNPEEYEPILIKAIEEMESLSNYISKILESRNVKGD